MNFKFTSEGYIELEHLQDQLSLEKMMSWMFQRLLGKDPFLSYGVDHSEPPENVFIEIWQRADSKSLIRGYLDQSCLGLLQKAWDSQPADWISHLLELIATICPKTCVNFFTNVLLCQTRREDYSEWLDAAASYEVQNETHIAIWKQFLEKGDFIDIAYEALSNNLEFAVFYLPDYYEAFPPKKQPVFISEAISDLIARYNFPDINKMFNKYWDRIKRHGNLSFLINKALEEMHFPLIVDENDIGPTGQAAVVFQTVYDAKEEDIAYFCHIPKYNRKFVGHLSDRRGGRIRVNKTEEMGNKIDSNIASPNLRRRIKGQENKRTTPRYPSHWAQIADKSKKTTSLEHT